VRGETSSAPESNPLGVSTLRASLFGPLGLAISVPHNVVDGLASMPLFHKNSLLNVDNNSYAIGPAGAFELDVVSFTLCLYKDTCCVPFTYFTVPALYLE